MNNNAEPLANDGNHNRVTSQGLLKKEYELLSGDSDSTNPAYGLNGKNLSALCLSGGGIRSSSFCYGVLQGIANAGDEDAEEKEGFDILGSFDYLSTVSGGGYIGSWLTANIHNSKDTASEVVNNQELQRALRNNARYLATDRSHVWSLMGHFLRNLLINWLALLPLIIALVAFILVLPAGWRWGLLLIGGLAYLVMAGMNYIWPKPKMFERGMGIGLKWTVFVGVLVTLVTFGPDVLSWSWTAVIGASSLVGLAPQIFQAFSWMQGRNWNTRWVVTAGAVFFHLFILALAALLVEGGLAYLDSAISSFLPAPLHPSVDEGALIMCLIALLVGAVFSLLDPNKVSLHDLYRNKLGEAFLDGSEITLREMGNNNEEPAGYPQNHLFHVLNATINLDRGRGAQQQERRGYSFTFTPWYSGFAVNEDEPTYFKTPKDVRLDTAMSISGAAVSPKMGYRTSGLLSFPMTLLNARLGVWYPLDPTMGRIKKAWFNLKARVLEAIPALEWGAGNIVYLSDGGHFDNLGLYEMIRRHCRNIVVVDAGQDQARSFADLGNAIRRVRSDFGVRITMNNQQTNRSLYAGTIHYSDLNTEGQRYEDGRLVVIRPELVGREPADVLAYASQNKAFPHETTTDQFFSESQYESYRALGKYIVENALADYQQWKGTIRKPLENATDLVDQLSEVAYSMQRNLTTPQLAGGIIYKLEKNEMSILFVESIDQSRLILPKGYIEAGETIVEAAAREIEEEAGLRFPHAAEESRFSAEFPRDDEQVQVAYVLFEASQGVEKNKGELRKKVWLSVSDVLAGDVRPAVPDDLKNVVTRVYEQILLEKGYDRAGGILYRFENDQLQVLFVDSSDSEQQGDWVLPKGHRKEHEHFRQAAIREIREEAGYRVEPEEANVSLVHTFPYRGDTIGVVYYVCDATEKNRYPSVEDRPLHWVTKNELRSVTEVPKDLREFVRKALDKSNTTQS